MLRQREGVSRQCITSRASLRSPSTASVVTHGCTQKGGAVWRRKKRMTGELTAHIECLDRAKKNYVRINRISTI